MSRTLALLAAGAFVFVTSAPVLAQSTTTPEQPAQPSQPAQQQGTSFESLDTNSDGKISKAEAAASSSVTAQFSKYDQNGDGFIERSEVNSANRAPSPEPGQQ